MRSFNRFSRNKLETSYFLVFLKFFLFAFFILICFFSLYFLLKGKSSKKKVFLVVDGEDFVRIVSFNFYSNEIVALRIPANTEVEVARNLGIWELSAVFKLGENEKIGGGKLLTETLRDNFFVPVFYYSSAKGKVLVEGGFFSSIYYPFMKSKSNLSFLEKVRIALFSARFKKSRLTDLDFSSSNLFLETILKSGRRGYKIKEEKLQDISWIFSDPLFLKNEVFISLINETGNSLIVGRLGRILETMGAKLGMVSNQNISDVDCEVSARDLSLISDLSLVFSCVMFEDKKLEKNEIVFRLGRRFEERF